MRYPYLKMMATSSHNYANVSTALLLQPVSNYDFIRPSESYDCK